MLLEFASVWSRFVQGRVLVGSLQRGGADRRRIDVTSDRVADLGEQAPILVAGYSVGS
jgi:hypothetical protein